jgi:hypothetical protein
MKGKHGQRAANGALVESERVADKAELLARLVEWLEDSTASTLGEPRGRFAGWAAITGSIGGHRFRLNADTTRQAISIVVRTQRSQPEPWAVIPTGRSERVAKVVPARDGTPLRGWYCYLLSPLTSRESI